MIFNCFYYLCIAFKKPIGMEYIFQRKIYQQLRQWKQDNDGRSAVLVEGARRIGKSTVVEEFAKQEYKSYILIDFNKASERVKSLFDDLTDLDYIFLFLQSIYHTTLYQRESVIIFDEVQKCPMARQAIKYLVQDGRYDYIETGSLISIKQNTEHITIPSEEDTIEMYPMDYEEFRWAMGDTATLPLLRQSLERNRSMGDDLNRQYIRDLRLYMLVGGMPQAVSEYLKTKNLRSVDMVKRKILKLYFDDFRKIDKTGKIGRLFQAIPAMLSHGIDTGLMVTLAFWDKSFAENVIYDKLLADRLHANMGYIYENLVAQMLKSSGNNLYFHTWPKDDKHNYEVDFLLSRGAKICPIEVKSARRLCCQYIWLGWFDLSREKRPKLQIIVNYSIRQTSICLTKE